MHWILSIVIILMIYTMSIDGAATASNCGSANDVIRLVSFQLTPDPIKVPSSSTPNVALFNLDVNLSEDVVHPIEAKVVLETKVLLFWVEAPCTNNAGSCTYPSFCDLCKTCDCPEKAGRHLITLPMNITSSVPKGDYRAEIDFRSATGQTGCVSIQNILLN